MKLFPAFAVLLVVGVVESASAQVARSGEINMLPMYGGFKKSRALQAADARFLATTDKEFPSRIEAADYFAKKGWEYFRQANVSTAIKRFNQAWLLDSTNAFAYWGFGVIEGTRQHHTDALRYFRLSLRHDPSNHRVFVDMALSLIGRYRMTHQADDLDTAISLSQLFIANSHDTNVIMDAYERLAVAYFLKHNYPTSWQCVDTAAKLNPVAVQQWEFLPELQIAAPRD